MLAELHEQVRLQVQSTVNRAVPSLISISPTFLFVVTKISYMCRVWKRYWQIFAVSKSNNIVFILLPNPDVDILNPFLPRLRAHLGGAATGLLHVLRVTRTARARI